MGTTEQVRQHPNPSGKGGFGENPQNRNPGGWNKDESISYWYNKLGRMEEAEFLSFKPANINQKIALTRVLRSLRDDKDSLAETREITDRTEGKAPQSLDLSNKDGSMRAKDLSDEEINGRIRQYIERNKHS